MLKSRQVLHPEYKCDAGMSVENVPAVVNIKALKARFIAHKFSTGWAVGVVKSGKTEECCWPVCSLLKHCFFHWTNLSG